jgi:hypothetical protein
MGSVGLDQRVKLPCVDLLEQAEAGVVGDLQLAPHRSLNRTRTRHTALTGLSGEFE